MALDKETQQLLHKVESFKRIVATDEWQEFRKEIFSALAEIIDIRNIKGDANFQVEVRKEVFRLLNEWIIKAEGIAQMNLTVPEEPDYIHRQE